MSMQVFNSIVFSVYFVLGCSISALAQFSDCNTATSVCSGLYEENNSPVGTGNVFEQSPGSCQTFGEFNSAWYVFTVQENGMLNFVLDPQNLADDYDWSLYDITTGGCAGINTGVSPEVSCNSYGSFDPIQGPTGISSALGGAGNSNGPGDMNGPPFNEDLDVVAGHVYALVIMNFSATLSGYTLDFGGSTASIFDDIPPTITDVEINCQQNQITFTLSESVPNEGFTVNNISILAGGNTIAPTSISTSGASYITEFTVNSNALSSFIGLASLQFDIPVSDICGNALSLTYDFQLDGAPTITTEISPACQGENGAIEVTIENGGACPSVTLGSLALASDNAECTLFSATAITAGSYVLSVINNDNGCVFTNNVIITDENPTISAGTDIVSCGLSAVLDANASSGIFQWLPLAGVVFSDPNDPQSNVSAAIAGDYLLTALVVLGDCEASDQINVTLNNPPEVDISVETPSCFYNCDGSVTFTDELNPQMNIAINGLNLSGPSATVSNLCAGEYDAFITFSPGCFSNYDVTIPEAPEFSASFEYSPFELTLENPTVQVINTSSVYDSIQWNLLNTDVIIPNVDAVELELPVEPGNYAIQLIVFAYNGCMQAITREITLRDELFIFVPNSFTPDNDGINDVFLPSLSYAPEFYELKIFNRWGQVVFESQDYKTPWLGEMLEGEYYSQISTYHWALKVKGFKPEIIEKQGVISLIR